MSTRRRLVIVALAGLLTATVALSSAAAALGDAESLADAWIAAKGWNRGFDSSSGRLVVVTSASVTLPPTNPAFVTARASAAKSAFEDARARGIEFLSAEIRTRAEKRLEVAEVVGDPEIARALTGLASDEAYVGSQELSDAVEVAANATLAGMYVAQSFESIDGTGRAEIALVTTVSPTSIDAVFGAERPGSGVEGTNSEALSDWFAAIEETALARTFGIRFAPSADGSLRPVAFGQAPYPAEPLRRDAARGVAEEAARGLLAELRGHCVTSRTLSESLSRSTESSSMSEAASRFMNRSNYSSTVRSESESRAGFETIGRRTVRDPASGTEIVVVAVSLARSPGSVGETVSGGVESGSGPAPAASAIEGNCPPVPENMRPVVRQVRASGSATTRDGACQAALLEAVRREGAQVKGSTILERRYEEALEAFESTVHEKVSARSDLSSKVETFADGFVYSYEVVRESIEDGLHEVQICANLVRFDPRDPRFGLPPTVAVVPFYCVADAIREGGLPVDCGSITRSCEASFTGALAAMRSFTVLSELERPALVELRDDIERRVQQGRSERIEALKLGQELTPDFVLVGRVLRAEFTGAPGLRPQRIAASDIATATIVAQLVNVASGEVRWSRESTVTLKGRDILLVRAGRDIEDPSEPTLSPMQLAVSRATRSMIESMKSELLSTSER
jgi:hypothetical protein